MLKKIWRATIHQLRQFSYFVLTDTPPASSLVSCLSVKRTVGKQKKTVCQENFQKKNQKKTKNPKQKPKPKTDTTLKRLDPLQSWTNFSSETTQLPNRVTFLKTDAFSCIKNLSLVGTCLKTFLTIHKTCFS